MHAEQDTQEARRAERYDLPSRGELLLPMGGRVKFEVNNISRIGAAIKLANYVIVPTEFIVEIESPDRTKLKRCECRRVWQSGGRVGVRFLSSQVTPLDRRGTV
ncbi:MAG: PilZ domain-containing protein [Pseudomonadota bacterium]